MAGRGKPRKLLDDSKHPCPVCGKPRSNGIKFIDHGKCMEALAAKAKTYNKDVAKTKLDRLSEESRRKSRFNQHSKKFAAGKLPDWMTDR